MRVTYSPPTRLVRLLAHDFRVTGHISANHHGSPTALRNLARASRRVALGQAPAAAATADPVLS